MALPAAEACVLRTVLERHAAERPDQVFAWFEDGQTWSYAETRRRTRRAAAALQGLGVGQGDHVLVWLANGPEALEAYFACGYLGAVYVPINTAYRGPLLAHVIENSDARLILAHAELVARLAEVATARLETVLVARGTAEAPPGLTLVDCAQALTGAGEPVDPARPIQPWDTQAIIYTSGTTGPSKGVLSSYLHNYAAMNQEAWPCVGPADRFLVQMPMFHVGGCFIVNAMLCRGGSIALADGFDTTRFWATVRASASTVVFLLGAMCTFLIKAPPRADEREHPLKTVLVVPYTEEAMALAPRFGVEVYTIFNMTEIATPLFIGPNPAVPGICGRPRAGFEVRVVDAHDIEVADGESGELLVRADQPWSLNHGYYKDPETTAKAWRNGWFHTGDAFRRDAAGDYYFVDRMNDAIRRRGENISSFEVEAVVAAHPAVQECAAVAVPSAVGEDEVMVVVAAKPGERLAPEDLIRFLIPRLAHFMVPRYVRPMAALPKTPTEKIQKAVLRREGVTPDTWDREAAGLRLKRERLG